MKHAPPTVTIALPVYNAETTLADTLESIAAQTLSSWELIMVCNGCTDGSENVARQWAARDPRMIVVSLARASVVTAANEAMRRARSPFIARIDADDRMMPRRLEVQHELLVSRPDLSACTGGVLHDGDPQGGMQRHVDWLNTLRTPELIHHHRFIDAPVANPSAMIRTELMREFGGFRDGDFAEDYDFWLRLLGSGYRIGRVEEAVIRWRDPPDRLTRTDGRYSVDAMRDLKHRFLVSGPLAAGMPCRIWGSGPYGKKHARGLRHLGVDVKAFIDIDPRKIGGQAAGGIPVCGPEAVAQPDGTVTLVAVASPGARDEVMGRLEARGHRLGRDYLPVQ